MLSTLVRSFHWECLYTGILRCLAPWGSIIFNSQHWLLETHGRERHAVHFKLIKLALIYVSTHSYIYINPETQGTNLQKNNVCTVQVLHPVSLNRFLSRGEQTYMVTAYEKNQSKWSYSTMIPTDESLDDSHLTNIQICTRKTQDKNLVVSLQ